jgi:hypothetical protein
MKKWIAYFVSTLCLSAVSFVWPTTPGRGHEPNDRKAVTREYQIEIQHEGIMEKKGTEIDCYQEGGPC